MSSNISSLSGQTNVYRPISFFVRLSPAITLNTNSIVKFNEVSVNEGNHFKHIMLVTFQLSKISVMVNSTILFLQKILHIYFFKYFFTYRTSQCTQTNIVFCSTVTNYYLKHKLHSQIRRSICKRVKSFQLWRWYICCSCVWDLPVFLDDANHQQ